MTMAAKLPIRYKLTLCIVVVSCIAILLTILCTTYNNIEFIKSDIVSEVNTLGKVIADANVAAVAFEDKQQALNNLGEDLIVYQGQELLVLKGSTQPAPALSTANPTSTPAQAATGVSTAPVISTPVTVSPTPTVTFVDDDAVPASNSGSSTLLVGLLIVAAFVGGGVAVWLIRDPN